MSSDHTPWNPQANPGEHVDDDELEGPLHGGSIQLLEPLEDLEADDGASANELLASIHLALPPDGEELEEAERRNELAIPFAFFTTTIEPFLSSSGDADDADLEGPAAHAGEQSSVDFALAVQNLYADVPDEQERDGLPLEAWSFRPLPPWVDDDEPGAESEAAEAGAEPSPG